jgi:hypothetical protein
LPPSKDVYQVVSAEPVAKSIEVPTTWYSSLGSIAMAHSHCAPPRPASGVWSGPSGGDGRRDCASCFTWLFSRCR